MATLLLNGLALVPERSQLDVEHAQRGNDSHAHVDIDRQPEPTRLQAGNRPQSAHQSPALAPDLTEHVSKSCAFEARSPRNPNHSRATLFSIN